MPKLKPETLRQRRERILDAAERCFADAGFHRTTMQDICKEAGISPGGLYVHFASKEDLIAGITERDRTKLAAKLADLPDAPDLLTALAKLGEHYALEEPHYKRVLCVEIGCEATRNPDVGEIYRTVDRFCRQSFEQVFARARESGRIAADDDPRLLAEVVSLIGDGLFWRRAVHPDFNAEEVLPVLVRMVSELLKPVEPAKEAARAPSAKRPPPQKKTARQRAEAAQ